MAWHFAVWRGERSSVKAMAPSQLDPFCPSENITQVF